MPDVTQPSAARLSRAVVVIALVGWLSGCGPGVGGTGTGEISGLSYFGATAATVCNADAGGVLGCAAGAGTAASVAGSPVVMLADAALAPRVQARVQDSTIELTVLCAGVRFLGEWGEVAGLGGRFFGTTGPQGAFMPATLQVQPSGGGVLVTLRDDQGVVLLGPTLLQVVPAAAAPGTCG